MMKGDKRFYWLLLMLLPSMGLAFFFNYLPVFGTVIAFQDYSPFLGIADSPFIGFDHFEEFLTDPIFYRVLGNTLYINLLDIGFSVIIPIVFALLLNEVGNSRMKKSVQTISYLPYFVSWIVVGGLFDKMLAPDSTGIVNVFLTTLFGIDPIYFMADENYFIGVVIFSEIWKSTGWSAILYFATLSHIDTQLYEAASIDGAGRFRLAWSITLPGLLPIIILNTLIKISNIFIVGFDRMFNLQNPAVQSISDILGTYIYRMGLLNSQFSETTAIGLVQSTIGLILLLLANQVSKKISSMGLF